MTTRESFATVQKRAVEISPDRGLEFLNVLQTFHPIFDENSEVKTLSLGRNAKLPINQAEFDALSVDEAAQVMIEEAKALVYAPHPPMSPEEASAFVEERNRALNAITPQRAGIDEGASVEI